MSHRVRGGSNTIDRFDDIMLEIILGLALACRRDARNLLLLDKRITRVLKGADRFKKIKMMVESAPAILHGRILRNRLAIIDECTLDQFHSPHAIVPAKSGTAVGLGHFWICVGSPPADTEAGRRRLRYFRNIRRVFAAGKEHGHGTYLLAWTEAGLNEYATTSLEPPTYAGPTYKYGMVNVQKMPRFLTAQSEPFLDDWIEEDLGLFETMIIWDWWNGMFGTHRIEV